MAEGGGDYKEGCERFRRGGLDVRTGVSKKFKIMNGTPHLGQNTASFEVFS